MYNRDASSPDSLLTHAVVGTYAPQKWNGCGHMRRSRLPLAVEAMSFWEGRSPTVTTCDRKQCRRSPRGTAARRELAPLGSELRSESLLALVCFFRSGPKRRFTDSRGPVWMLWCEGALKCQSREEDLGAATWARYVVATSARYVVKQNARCRPRCSLGGSPHRAARVLTDAGLPRPFVKTFGPRAFAVGPPPRPLD